MAGVPGYQDFKIGGVSVYFPCRPYPSQFSMMDKIIKGLERSQNCLLESPTGSGKSLALLCSALAWQQAEKEKRDREEEAKQKLLDEAEEGVTSCGCGCHIDSAKKKATEESDTSAYFPVKENNNSVSHTGADMGDEDDFKDENKSFRTPGQANLSKKIRKHVSISYEDYPASTSTSPKTHMTNGSSVTMETETSPCCSKECEDCDCSSLGKTKKRKIPKIYFGTRTHKQVAQIVRELKKTAYHDVKMTILGSREHTCIHPEVSRMANKNEGCRDLLKGPGCRMKDRAKAISTQAGIRMMGLTTAWDLEDMVSMCKKKKACPYFLTRALKDQCEIIICPYNYLVDPIIRDSMEILVKDQIIILDEAHNIEDSSREAGSQSLKQEVIQKSIHELQAMINGDVDLAESVVAEQVMRGLDTFLNMQGDKLEQKDFDQSYKIWSGFDIVAQMNLVGLGPTHMERFGKAIKTLCEEKEEVPRGANGEELKLSSQSMTLIEQILKVLDYMYRNDMKYVEDYRLSIVKATTFVSNQQTNGAWLNPRNRHGGQKRIPMVTCTLNFWCLNPAVAFSDFANCRSVVLSSGTLSPMSSFSSELGMTFSIQLEANHVIKDNQVWVGAIGQGPNGTSLQAVYRNIETYNFQDELGHLVFSVCKTVPHGVLCFFPSYNCLDKLSNRWKTTGLWNKLHNLKKIVAEPRGSDKLNFEELMNLFYEAIDNKDGDDRDGALFLAVCRGKVSEGLDFADNFARAVITVGIPYPNFKDIQVNLKRSYNDQHRASRGLLSGSDWYEIQAYRALNQALGRCIRHKRDWGALIMVDERFVKNPQKYNKGLSKWVRNKAVAYNTFQSAMDSLSSFTRQRIEAMENEEPETSFVPSTPSSQCLDDSKTPRKPLYDQSNMSTSYIMDTSKPMNTSLNSSVALTPDLGLKMSGRSSIENKGEKQTSNAFQKKSAENTAKKFQNQNKSQTFLSFNVQPGKKVLTVNDTMASDSLGHIQTSTPKIRGQKTISVLGGHDTALQSPIQIQTPQKHFQNTAGKKFDVSHQGPDMNSEKNTNLPEKSSCIKQEPNSTVTQDETKRSVNVGSDKTATNRFFKFHFVPKTQSSDFENHEVCDKDKKPEVKACDQENVTEARICDGSKSPLLFELASSETNSVDTIEAIPEKSNLKKPLFKRRKSLNCDKSDLESKAPNSIQNYSKDSNSAGCHSNLKQKGGDSKSRTVNPVSKGDHCCTKNENCSIKEESYPLKGDNSGFMDGTFEHASDDMDELEGLMLRRRSSRQKKRKSDGHARPGSKRSRGVDFLDGVGEEKKSESKKIMCSECGSLLIDNVKDVEMRKRLPPFLKIFAGKQNPQVVYLDGHDGDDLQVFTSDLDNGVSLNCHYDEDSRSIVQYVRCGGSCESGDVLGCRVKHVAGSQYHKGQMWLFHQRVKML